MEFIELAKRRYSCRRYQDKPVERNKLAACIEAARMSPSACNSQRWLFVAVDDPARKEGLAKALYCPETKINTHADKTPAFIVLVQDPVKNFTELQKKLIGNGEYWDLDIGIAGENICLAATDMGLGTVMMSRFNQDLAREALDVPDNLKISLIIGLGYPLTDEIRCKTRKELADILRWNSLTANP